MRINNVGKDSTLILIQNGYVNIEYQVCKQVMIEDQHLSGLNILQVIDRMSSRIFQRGMRVDYKNMTTYFPNNSEIH